IGLQTAVVAAFTEPPFGRHCCMAKLSSPPECSTIEIAINHDAKPDTASNDHHQEMLIRLTLTEEFLINRQTIDIIIKKDRNAQALFQGTADLNVLPVHYPGINAASVLSIHQPAHAYPHTDNLLPCNATLTQQFLDALREEVYCLRIIVAQADVPLPRVD